MEAVRLTPHLCVDAVDAAGAFYRRVFGARTWLGLGVALDEEDPAAGLLGPKALGGSPVTLHVDVGDVDAALRRALAAGGAFVSTAQDQQCGGRAGRFEDPFGHRWHIAWRRDVPVLGAGMPVTSIRGTAAPPSP